MSWGVIRSKSKQGDTLICRAPAKLNLRLKIEARREDGYHLLSMLNATTSLYDTVTITITDALQIGLEVKGSALPQADLSFSDPASNLATLAAQHFVQEFKLRKGIQIGLQKEIPIGAGLGGGSTDAAAVLRALAHYILEQDVKACDPAAVQQKLLAIALALGADVPFFVKGGFARVTGIGEQVELFDARFITDYPCYLLVPKAPLLTKDVYQNFDQNDLPFRCERDLLGEHYAEILRLNTPAPEYDPLPSKTVLASLRRQLFTVIENDLEPAAVRLQPSIGSALELVRAEKDLVAAVTGSGSAFFALPRTSEYVNSPQAATLEARLGALPLTIHKLKLLPKSA